ncbi:MAG: Small-conductance mechanosensitive channel MscMJ [Candidatus Methanocomedens sp.]|nr:MAG: Small-conductance mechanosensitive channel MscMJ [ANME-2 cluster archaeon]
MITIPDILNIEMLDLSLEKLGLFFIIILLTYIVRFLFLHIVEKKLIYLTQKTSTEFDDLLVHASKAPIGYLILLHGFYIAIITLQLPETIGVVNIGVIVKNAYILILSFILLYYLFKLIDLVGHFIYGITEKTESKLDDQLAPLIVKSLRIFVITLGILFILNNFGYNIASLLAGLGIGGLAFALAAQDTVSNLFGSFTIFSDKPFHMGDWIKIGDFEGTVEDVGFRSTRIRRFDQAQVTVPNSQFIKNGVINYTAMKKRRIKFNLGVTYATTAAQMTEVVEGIKQIIKEDHRFDHNFYMVHFTDFGDYALNIFVYCFTKTTVWDEYLTVREEFHLKIMQMLEEMGVEIAFPTQTVYVEKG